MSSSLSPALFKGIRIMVEKICFGLTDRKTGEQTSTASRNASPIRHPASLSHPMDSLKPQIKQVRPAFPSTRNRITPLPQDLLSTRGGSMSYSKLTLAHRPTSKTGTLTQSHGLYPSQSAHLPLWHGQSKVIYRLR